VTKVSVPAAAESCAACGAPVDECRCAQLRDALVGRAAALQRAGMTAARDGELHRSLALLRRAARLAPLDPDAARVLALVALCLGDAEISARAWPSSGSEEPSPLDRDSVRDALHFYNQALAEAQVGDNNTAASRANEALERLPDLVPAHRLRALLAAERGEVSTAREACEAGLAVCRDDAVLRLCLASLPASDAPAPVAPVASIAPVAPPPARARISAPVAAAWAGSVILAIFLTQRLGNPPGPDLPPSVASSPVLAPAATAERASPSPPATATPSPPPADFAALITRLDAFARGDWARAAVELSGAAATPADAYYRDDALYLLARAQARAAHPDEARRTAALLLRDHPASIFANRITRRIAERGSE